MGAVESTIFVVCLVALCFAVYAYVQAYLFNNEVASKTITQGVNGKEGDTVLLSCPSGMNINVYKATYFCSGLVDGLEASTSCEPIQVGQNGNNTDYGNFDPNNTVDAVSALSSQCNGKNSCVFTIPASTAVRPCSQSTTPMACPSYANQPVSMYLTGSYYCSQ